MLFPSKIQSLYWIEAIGDGNSCEKCTNGLYGPQHLSAAFLAAITGNALSGYNKVLMFFNEKFAA